MPEGEAVRAQGVGVIVVERLADGLISPAPRGRFSVKVVLPGIWEGSQLFPDVRVGDELVLDGELVENALSLELDVVQLQARPRVYRHVSLPAHPPVETNALRLPPQHSSEGAIHSWTMIC